MVFALIGFMGCGKSSVGRMAAERLGMRFLDLDVLIENKEHRSIPEIFSTDGEPAFRRMEIETLKTTLESDEPLLLALGGGTPTIPEAADLLGRCSCVVYLAASVRTILAHLSGELDSRPLLKSGGESAVQELLSRRLPLYERIADVTVCVDGLSREQAADSLECRLREIMTKE